MKMKNLRRNLSSSLLALAVLACASCSQSSTKLDGYESLADSLHSEETSVAAEMGETSQEAMEPTGDLVAESAPTSDERGPEENTEASQEADVALMTEETTPVDPTVLEETAPVAEASPEAMPTEELAAVEPTEAIVAEASPEVMPTEEVTPVAETLPESTEASVLGSEDNQLVAANQVEETSTMDTLSATAPVVEEAPVTENTEMTGTTATEAAPLMDAPATMEVTEEAPAANPAPRLMPATKAPQAPSKTITRKSITMNRYYFLRQGDTPASVSQLLYGSEERAEELKSLNKGWKSGSMITYVSAVEAEDDQMSSFYEENGVTGEEHVVKAGESLSGIAMARYGSMSAWKEIAVLNKLKNPDTISAGQKLTLMPTSLVAYSAQANGQWVAETKTEVAPAKAVASQEPVAAPAKIEEHPMVAPTQVVETSDEEAFPVAKPEQRASLASAEIGSFIEKHMLTLAVSGAAALFICFLVMRRRKDEEEKSEF